MKILFSVSYCLLFLFIATNLSIAQTMKPDAARLYNEGNKFLKEGKYQQAIGVYDKALKIQEDFRTFYQRGVALKNTGKLKEAKDSFESSIKAKPDFALAYNALGGIYFAMGKYQKAADNFQKVVDMTKNKIVKEKVQKNIAFAYAKLGDNAVSQGNPKKAITYLKKAVENSNYDAAYLSLAKIYSETGKYDSSLKAAENALKYRTTIGEGGPYYYMGVAYKKKGNIAEAKKMFDIAKKDPRYKRLAKYELTALR
ncbi:MAG TPA: tetratricopeptide repeat protein [Ignavibacteria bacterium]|nr:tetratricopeptide repeat protein [Ignavibacteria bacterium]